MHHSEMVKRIEENAACMEAKVWYEESGLSPQEAWEQCPNGVWMLWTAALEGVDLKLRIKAACACARLQRNFPTPPAKFIKLESWANDRGGVTLDEVSGSAYPEGVDKKDPYKLAIAIDSLSSSGDAAQVAINTHVPGDAELIVKQMADLVREHIKASDVWGAE